MGSHLAGRYYMGEHGRPMYYRSWIPLYYMGMAPMQYRGHDADTCTTWIMTEAHVDRIGLF